MKYNVSTAEVVTIPAGKENAGQKYVKLGLEPQDIFDPKSHVICMFVDQKFIPAWELRCQDIKSFPVFNGAEIVVDNLPPFNFINSKTNELVMPQRTSTSVFVRINADGMPADDARSVACRTISQMGKWVDTDAAPVAAPATELPPM